MKWLSLGYRNLLRNRRRSAGVVLSIAIGFAAVVLFAGYMKMVYRGLSDQAVYGEMIGHFTLSKPGFATEGRLNPGKFLLTEDEIRRISDIVHAVHPELQVAPRLALSGLLSNGRASTVFIGEGVDPDDMAILRGPRRMASGALRADQAAGISVADGLAGVLGLADGAAASILVSTLHGQANAADATVLDTFSTGNAGTNDKFLFMPLRLAQSLVDADGRADRLTLIDPHGYPGDAVGHELADAMDKAGLPLQVRTWVEISGFYRQVKSMFDMIFSFLLVIVLTIVVMSVSNAMTMGVIERTREIGTLRAIGMQRGSVVSLFFVEALLLAGSGCLAGLAIAGAARYGVNSARIAYLPPNSTDAVLLQIGFDVPRTSMAALVLVLLAVSTALLPAWRAARCPINESLGHV